MVAAIAGLQIDLVAMLSPWPETFSYTTFEALAGGAEVICLADSGNIADTVLHHGRGVVIPQVEEMIEFFVSGEAARYGWRARQAPMPRGRLLHQGTAATLPGRSNP